MTATTSYILVKTIQKTPTNIFQRSDIVSCIHFKCLQGLCRSMTQVLFRTQCIKKNTGRGSTSFCKYDCHAYIMYLKVSSNYTNVYAPISIDSQSEPEVKMEQTAEERY